MSSLFPDTEEIVADVLTPVAVDIAYSYRVPFKSAFTDISRGSFHAALVTNGVSALDPRVSPLLCRGHKLVGDGHALQQLHLPGVCAGVRLGHTRLLTTHQR